MPKEVPERDRPLRLDEPVRPVHRPDRHHVTDRELDVLASVDRDEVRRRQRHTLDFGQERLDRAVPPKAPDPAAIAELLGRGADKAAALAGAPLVRAREAVGLLPRSPRDSFVGR